MNLLSRILSKFGWYGQRILFITLETVLRWALEIFYLIRLFVGFFSVLLLLSIQNGGGFRYLC